ELLAGTVKEVFQMESMSHTLARLHQRPEFFIRARRITLLEAFIDGYLYAQVGSQDMKVFGQFRGWLHKSKGAVPSPGLATELMGLAGGDEAGFDAFFRLFNEFARSLSTGIEAPGDIHIKWPSKNQKDAASQ